MSHKTKAALQSRSCRFTALNSNFQDITVIDQVNSEAGNPAWETVIPVSVYNSQFNSLFIMQVLTLRTDAGEISSAKNFADVVPQSVSTMYFCIPRVAPMVHPPLYGYVSRCEENRISLLMNYSVYQQGTSMAYTPDFKSDLLHTSFGVVQISPLRSPVLGRSSFDRYPDIGYRSEENRNSLLMKFSTLSLWFVDRHSYKNSGGHTTFLSCGYSRTFFLGSSHPPSTSSDLASPPGENQFPVSGLGFLRCTAFSLRPQASNTHAEKLEPGLSAFSRSTLASISSIRSYGKRIPTREDLLFLLPVAIVDNLLIIFGECTPYIKGSRNKMLDVGAHQNIKWLHTLPASKAQEVSNAAKPRGALTPSGLLTTTVSESNEAAMKDHITHPQGRNNYIWRFLALSAIGRNVIHITATTEREAREQSPVGCVIVLAGRLPVQEVRHA